MNSYILSALLGKKVVILKFEKDFVSVLTNIKQDKSMRISFDVEKIDNYLISKLMRKKIADQGEYVLITQTEPSQTICELFKNGEQITFRGDSNEDKATFLIFDVFLKDIEIF